MHKEDTIFNSKCSKWREVKEKKNMTECGWCINSLTKRFNDRGSQFCKEKRYKHGLPWPSDCKILMKLQSLLAKMEVKLE